MSSDYNWSRYTPIDNTGKDRTLHRSAYKNIRFRLRFEKIIQLTDADVANLPGLAFKHFGDVSLWEVLLRYNGLSDPLTDIYAGQVLKVPTKASVTAYLAEQQNNKPVTYTI